MVWKSGGTGSATKVKNNPQQLEDVKHVSWPEYGGGKNDDNEAQHYLCRDARSAVMHARM